MHTVSRRFFQAVLLLSIVLANGRIAAAQDAVTISGTRNSTVNSFNGIQTFPRHSPFGMNGRAIYARIGRTF